MKYRNIPISQYCLRKIRGTFHDTTGSALYYKNMGRSTKQNPIHSHQQQVGHDYPTSSTRLAKRGENALPFQPYGSLERLARILVEIARSPHIENDSISRHEG